MTRRQFGRDTGNSEWINVSVSEFDQLALKMGNAVDVNIAEDRVIAGSLIDSKDSDRFLIVTAA